VDLDGKRVVITGAASGIGKALAAAAGPSGARLILTDPQRDAARRDGRHAARRW
jgi:NAD(P)-dependent dehydrogenase (short-subunit alcohol dehydrogenase family)